MTVEKTGVKAAASTDGQTLLTVRTYIGGNMRYACSLVRVGMVYSGISGIKCIHAHIICIYLYPVHTKQ